MKSIPRTWFSTSLTGSAGEMEERLRALFQGAKKRPPVLALLALALGVGLCGNLISCQQTQAAPIPSSNGTEDTPAPIESESAVTTTQLVASPPRQNPLLEVFSDAVAAEGFLLEEQSNGKVLVSRSGKGTAVFTASTFTDDGGNEILAIGVVQDETTLKDGIFVSAQQGGSVHTVTWNKDGVDYFLYTNNGMHQGYSGGEGGVVAFDGSDIRWIWPVEGDLRDPEGTLRREYQDYFETHKPLLCSGGVEIFSLNESFGLYDGSPVQWEPESSEIFYNDGMEALPIGVFWKVRVWLEEFSRDSNNPYGASNLSAMWRIEQIKPVEQHKEGSGTYQVKVRADNNDALYAEALVDLDVEHHITLRDWQFVDSEKIS